MGNKLHIGLDKAGTKWTPYGSPPQSFPPPQDSPELRSQERTAKYVKKKRQSSFSNFRASVGASGANEVIMHRSSKRNDAFSGEQSLETHTTKMSPYLPNI